MTCMVLSVLCLKELHFLLFYLERFFRVLFHFHTKPIICELFEKFSYIFVDGWMFVNFSRRTHFCLHSCSWIKLSGLGDQEYIRWDWSNLCTTGLLKCRTLANLLYISSQNKERAELLGRISLFCWMGSSVCTTLVEVRLFFHFPINSLWNLFPPYHRFKLLLDWWDWKALFIHEEDRKGT